MATLDSFLAHLSSQDTKKKLSVGTDILNYLSVEDNSLECENLSAFIDSIIHWLSNSNFKVAQNGLEILAQLSFHLGDDLKPYLSSILVPTTDRLGDSKDCVREQAKVLLSRLMNSVSTPQNILEKLIPAFSHKNWRVREEMCFFFQECLLRYGVVGSTNGQLLVSKFVPPLVALVSDQNLQVRDTSMATLVEIYKHVGDRLRQEILRKHSNMPHQKLQTLLSKFDDIASTGEVAPSSSSNSANGKLGSRRISNASSTASDDVDFKKTPVFKRATSAPPVKRNNLATAKYALSSKSSGAADEEMFMNSFEEVPRVSIFSVKDLEQELSRIKDVCSDPNNEWEKRTDCLRKLRSLLLAGAADYDEFYAFLKPLEVPFQVSVKDLRSQVVREACISIAYLSQRIANKCDRFAEALLPTLINLIQNSAKIMSSSGVVAIRFIIQHTHASKLTPIITYNISSKSKEIRKACCEFLDQLLHTWSTHTLEKHVGILQEAIKKGISDADPEARAFARKAFWGFADKFKAEADYLLYSLDSNKQKLLQGEQISNWSSTNSLNKASAYSVRPQTSRTNSVSTNGSMESINRHFSTLKRSAIPVYTPKPALSSRTPVRATSAIDIDAQKRARAKANSYLNQPKVLLNSLYSMHQTPRKPPSTISNDERSSSSSRKNRVSKSQPGSRSASPSSRLSYYSNIPSSGDSGSRTPRVRKLSVTSREPSPSRTSSSHSPGDIMQTPFKIKNYYNAGKMNYYDDAENLNPDDIYDSLMKTSEQIQKYSFNLDSETLAAPNNNYMSANTYNGGSNNVHLHKPYKKLDHLSSASLDSGISQIDGIKNSPVSAANEVAKVSPKLASIPVHNNHHNHHWNEFANSNHHNSLTHSPTTNGFSPSDTLISRSVIKFNSVDSESYMHNLTTIIQLVQQSSPAEVAAKYNDIYKSLLSKFVGESNAQVRILILQAIGQIVHKSPYEEYMEPTVMRLLEASKDSEKDVVKAAEEAANFAMSSYGATRCFQLLKPYVNSGESALSIASIKMLTKLIECNKPQVNDLLPELMPALLQAYDNVEIAVRKATVFCMVAIFGAVGEVMNTYLKDLSTTKSKLLKLYIDRSIKDK